MSVKPEEPLSGHARIADGFTDAETEFMSHVDLATTEAPEAADDDLFEDDLNPFELAPGRRHDVKPRGMVCTHCKGNTVLVSGEEIYPHRPDLFDRYFWLCRPCKAWVGCHRAQRQMDAKGKEIWSNGAMPLGSVANKELRALRHRVHALFDPMWKTGAKSRAEAYNWLSGVLGARPGKAHVAWMDIDQCKLAIAALSSSAATGADEAQPEASHRPTRPAAEAAPIDMAAETKLAEKFSGQVGNLRWLVKQLNGVGVQYQVRNNGHHILVHAAQGAFDVWPSTQRWKSRQSGDSGQGLDALLRRVRVE